MHTAAAAANKMMCRQTKNKRLNFGQDNKSSTRKYDTVRSYFGRSLFKRSVVCSFCNNIMRQMWLTFVKYRAGESQKYLLIIPFILFLFLSYEYSSEYRYLPNNITAFPTESRHTNSYEISKREKLRASSILGQWLRAPEASPPPPKKTMHRSDSSSSPNLLILVWKYGPFLEKRHIHRLNANISSSPWQDCSVNDCRLSYHDQDLSEADAVIFHLHLTKSVRELPRKKGKIGQIWIFMTDESPLHTFLYHQYNPRLSDFNNLFDWSMTYRSDSDVPVAYGRTIKRRKRRGSDDDGSSIMASYQSKSKLVAIMGSNCSNKNSIRWEYARQLKILLGDKFDIYGRCLGGNTTACPGHYDRDCPILNAYKFYLAFENSNCREYITEKVYWNAYEKGSVPIVMGAPQQDCQILLPPHSFIHIDDFSTPKELASYLTYLDTNDAAYARYHQWRLRYIVLNEHGYFGSISRHYCRICEALRYNNIPPVNKSHNDYRFIENYWNATRDCNFRNV